MLLVIINEIFLNFDHNSRNKLLTTSRFC